LVNTAIQENRLHIENFSKTAKGKYPDSVFKGFSRLAAMAFNTTREKKAMAVLVLGFRRRRMHWRIERDLLKHFNSKWLPVLENVWLLGRYREIVKVGQDINQTLKEPRELFEHLFRQVSKILDTKYFFMLAVYHEQNNKIDYHMGYRDRVKHSESKQLDL